MRREASSGRGLTDRNIALAVVFGVVLGGFYALHVVNKQGIASLAQRYREGQEEERGKLERRLKEVKEQHDEMQQKLEDSKKVVLSLREEARGLRDVLDQAVAERNKINAELESKQPVSLKIGKPGTVKGPRSSPEVAVDESYNPQLATVLRGIVRVKEVHVTFADISRRPLLDQWLDAVKRLHIAGSLVVVLDKETEAVCHLAGVPVFLHLPSGPVKDPLDFGREKFRLLRDFLALGYKVLVSDVDVVFIKNPLEYLVRDCDVEAMSAVGTDVRTYGEGFWIDDPAMQWARFAVTTRQGFLDTGFFYLLPTRGAVELLDRVVARLDRRAANDTVAAVFNKELFLPSSREYAGLYASFRIMDYAKFINPRYILKGADGSPVVVGREPVLIHANLDKDKEAFVAAAVVFAKENNLDPLLSFNSLWDSAL